MLSNAVRSAMTKLLVPIILVALGANGRANAEEHLDLVVAIDLTQSVDVTGPDGSSEFQKNIDGVSRVLAQVPAGTRVTIVGITDHSFSQPYILMSARVGDDPGYFGERLSAARNQLVRAWKAKSTDIEPGFRHTDILGSLRLAGQIFAQQRDPVRRTLVIFSDMRQNTPEMDLESPKTVAPYQSLAKKSGVLTVLKDVQVYVLGADGAGRGDDYWRSLERFWRAYFCESGTDLQTYSNLRTPQWFASGE